MLLCLLWSFHICINFRRVSDLLFHFGLFALIRATVDIGVNAVLRIFRHPNNIRSAVVLYSLSIDRRVEMGQMGHDNLHIRAEMRYSH